MKKIVCFLMMLFMMVGVSKAEFTTSGITYKTQSNSSTTSYSLTANYTLTNVWNNTKNYYAGTLAESIYNDMIDELRSNGFGLFYSQSGTSWNVVVYPYDSVDLGYYNSRIYLHGTTDETVYWYSQQSASGYGSLKISTSASATYAYAPNYSYEPLFMSDSVKLLTMSSSKLYWDGESYYYQAETEPEEPKISADLAGLISAITSSSTIQDNKGYGKDEYFIIPFGQAFGQSVYEVYFYASHLNLSQYEYLNSDRYYYDLNKTSADGIIGTIADFIVGDNAKGTFFTVVHDSESDTYSITFNGKFTFNEDYLSFLDSELNPIIYTTKDIAYYLYEKDENGEWIATADESKNIVNEVIIDSDGVEVSPEVLGSNSSVAETPWERFISAIQSIPTTLLDGIKKIFIPDLSYLDTTMEHLKNKLGFITQAKDIVNNITNGIELNPLAPPSITLDLGNANSKYDWGGEAICLDLSWYEPYKPAVDFLIICFCYGFFFWNLFRKLPDILSGVAGDAVEANYQMEVAAQNSRRGKFGFNTKR